MGLRSYAAIAAAMLVLTGCGSDNDSNNNNNNNEVEETLSSITRDANFLTDADGETLYVFDADTIGEDGVGISNCQGMCAVVWPYFYTGSSDSTFSTITTVNPVDGVDVDFEHTALFGKHPLYYYYGDIEVGETYGNWFNGVWHPIFAYTGFTETDSVKRSAETHSQTYLTGSNGLALYTFDNDTANTSNCTAEGNCTGIWPVYYIDPATATLPDGVSAADLGVIDHPDGGKQTTYKSQPLYYYFADTASGDTNGDWVKGVWHLVEIKPEIIDEETQGVEVAERTVPFLTNTEGFALYTFDADGTDASNCINGDAPCQTVWPDLNNTGTVTTPFGTLVDGGTGLSVENSDHIALFGHPLYTFINDTEAGQTNGHLKVTLGYDWHLIHDASYFADALTSTTDVELSDTDHTHYYLTDNEGRALYTFDADGEDANDSACVSEVCFATWPVFDANVNLMQVADDLNRSEFGSIVRSHDGKRQTTYKGKPLYYYVGDAVSAGTKGDWFGGVWHLIDLEAPVAEPTPEPEPTGDAEVGAVKFAASCSVSSCHGPDGKNPPLGVDNIIANINDAEDIKSRLLAMKNGTAVGKNGTMVGIAEGLSDQEILDLSAFIATLEDAN